MRRTCAGESLSRAGVRRTHLKLIEAKDRHARSLRWPFSGTSTSPTIPTTWAARIPCPGSACTAPRTTGAWPSCSSEVPELHATINLVPSLLKQLAAYTDGGHQDTHLRVSRLPADGLCEDDMHYLLDNFFMVHPDHMIRPYPRYHELYRKRGLASIGRTSPQAIQQEGPRRPAMLVQPGVDPPAGLRAGQGPGRVPREGPHWTEKEKQWLLDQQMELLRQVVPLHRELAGARPGGADDHAVLPPDPAAAVGQASGPPGDARAWCCPTISKAIPRTPASRCGGPSSITRSFSARSPAACGPPRARSARP